MSEHLITPDEQMMQWMTSKWITKPIYVVSELGVADVLRDGPLSVEDIAERTDAHSPSLYRILRALSTVGVFVETDDRVFGLTPLARCLLSDAMRPMARMLLSDWHDKAWSGLFHAVRTGKPGFDKAFGKPAFEWLEENADARAVFDQAQGLKVKGFSEAVIEAVDVSDCRLICDVGGGQGTFLTQILTKYPHLEGMVADLPGAVASAQQTIAEAGLSGRCEAVFHDILKAPPPICDAYFMVNILHDWDDETCHRVLRNLSRSMNGGSRLWIVEYIIEPGPGFSIAKLLDIEVFVMGGGRERTLGEYEALLGAVGLTASRITPTTPGPTVMECVLREMVTA